MSTEREISYGGLVVRGDEVLVITPAGRHRISTLPKGGADAGESAEQAAVREVREETGVEAAIRGELGEVQYWYRRGGRSIFKTVRYFLCDYRSGDTADHDDEVEEARWIPLDLARSELSYPGERELAERALSKLGLDR